MTGLPVLKSPAIRRSSSDRVCRIAFVDMIGACFDWGDITHLPRELLDNLNRDIAPAYQKSLCYKSHGKIDEEFCERGIVIDGSSFVQKA